MAYKIKKSIPKREDFEYKEIENFEDFELINNAFYEMGIRTNRFKKLTKIFAYCDNLFEQIDKLIKWDDTLKDIKSADYTDTEKTPFPLIQRTAKENFEDALKELESKDAQKYNKEVYDLLELDFESFKKEIEVSSIEDKTNDELINNHTYIETFLDIIPKIVEEELYIDFYSYYSGDEDNKLQNDIEYNESSATSLYIKCEYKTNYYIETTIDSDNNKITRTLYPLSKRKLLTDHIPKFSSNHLILYKQVTEFIENLFKATQVKLKKQIALAGAFFCYDYYHYRLEEVAKQNQIRKKQNLENVILQEAIDSIELITNDINLTYQEKKQKKIQDEEVIRAEKRNLLKEPTLSKNSKFYIFDEPKFKKSGINRSTALKYYDWIKPYIDGEYIKIINTEQLL